jgi:prolyl oligopeptidase
VVLVSAIALIAFANVCAYVYLKPALPEVDSLRDVQLQVPLRVYTRDGKLIAASLSENGSEEGTLYIYETATGQQRPDLIGRVQGATAGGSAAWNADGSGLFYTRYPSPGERPGEDLHFFQQVYFHKLGTPVEQDTYELGKEFPRIAETQLEASPDGRYTLASVANGDGGEYAHYLREPSGAWRQITRFEDQVKRIEFGRDPLYLEWGKDDTLYLLSRKDAPKGKILRLPLSEPDLTNAETIFPGGTNVIDNLKPAASGLCLVFLKGGSSEFAYWDYFDNIIRTFQDPAPTAFQDVLVTQGDDILLHSVTYTEPFAWMRYNPSRTKERVDTTALAGKAPCKGSRSR